MTMPGATTCMRCHQDTEQLAVLCNECRTEHEATNAVAKIQEELHDAIAKEGDYITPGRCKEVILGVIKKHTDAGNILVIESCPFCGGEAMLTEAMGESWVKCKICNASSGMRGTTGLAIAAWNTRR